VADLLNLYDLAPAELHRALSEVVSPAFRVRQVEEWLQRGVGSFDAMTNLSKDIRAVLVEKFTVAQPEIVTVTEPAADGSRKYLFRLADGQRIESVFMMIGDRVSVCLSSQAGCAVGCTFCVTGFFGAGRNLTPAEMLGQFYAIQREQQVPMEQMNVVFMGMGEPLLNFENLVLTLDALYQNVAPKRVTVSTSGIIPGIEQLARLERRPNLAISINAPDRKRREEIMPITAKYPLQQLMAALHQFPLEKGRELTIEYVLLAGYNDSPRDAVALAKLIRSLHAKVNAIPFNEDANLPDWMKRPSDREIDRFVDTLVRNGVRVTVRRSKGRDIAAACGQLRGKEIAKSRATRERPRRTASEPASEADSRR
jgi:23S rRNA (adenine2503-C2)-methyltransferase